MGRQKSKPIIGILGGIASGKSTVAREFAKLGCAVIDADEIAHDLLNEPTIAGKVIDQFGQGILDEAGSIDRKKLGDIVFADARKLELLNRILHPSVLGCVEQMIEQFEHDSQVKAIVLDMPLLMEIGWHKRCDRLIFVDCKAEIRLQRARELGILDEAQMKIRENFQIFLDSKAGLADNMIDNNSGYSTLVGQVADIFYSIVSSRQL
jgi:dephospho-CoA kinase